MDEQLSSKFKRFHVGCGPVMADGFLNIDGDFGWIPKKLKDGVPYPVAGRPDTFILKHDLRSGIPAQSGSLQVIYHSHFLEHLADEEGRAFLSECHRCLASGGLMRFAVPDLGLWCANYVSGKDDFFDWYRQTYLTGDRDRYATNASVFMGMLYNWGHKMAYDFETLSALLAQVGFANVRRAEWGVSENFPAILSVEAPTSERRPESLVLECTRS